MSGRRRWWLGRSPLLVAGIAVAVAGGTVPLAAQEVRGTLLAAELEMPLPYGAVELLGPDLSVAASVFTDERGRFVLVAPGPGRYALRGTHMNAQPLIAGDLQLSLGQVVEVELALPLRPIELDSLLVSVEPEYRFLVRNGFYERATQGFGSFVTPELIDRWQPFRTTDLLRRMPGVRIEPHPERVGRYLITFPRAALGQISGGAGRRCQPKVVVDDVVMQDFDIDDLPVDGVFAIEVYRSGMQTPPRYGGGNAACGVIVLWTGVRFSR